MNKLILTIIIVVIAGVGVFFLFGRDGTVNNNEKVTDTLESDIENGKFADILIKGKNVECTFEEVDGVNKTTGIVYIADKGERIRGNFELTQGDGAKMQNNIIRNEGWNYIWGSFSPQGIKSKVTEQEKDKLFSSDKKDGPALNEDVNFDCKKWNVDNSKFNPPSSIEFMDITANIKQMEEATQMTGDLKCSACDQISDPASKSQCLQALGC